jgi:RNA polymerase sigma-70 factor (ECF subfamily)
VDGDAAPALEALYRQRYVRFVATAGAIAGAEAGHDVVARALRAAERLPGEPRELERYVWRVVVNCARDASRRRRDVPLDEELGLAVVDAVRDPAIADALRALPPRRRAVIFLFHLADLSLAEVAELLHVSQGTVSATLAQARDALRQALEGATR